MSNLIEIKLEGTRDDGADYSATGQYDPDKNELTVYKDSRWAKTLTTKDSRSNERFARIRKGIVDDGYVDETTGVFKDNYTFSAKGEKGDEEGTPIISSAGTICGAARNADSSWKTVAPPQMPLFKYLEQIGVIQNVGKNGKLRKWKSPDSRGSFVSDNSTNSASDNIAMNSGDDYLRQNVIFYGVPGCGKSHKVNMILNGVDAKYYKRILFHPEYTYSDFVGQLRPVTEDGKITYQFVPGPFTKILCDAYADPGPPYFLIIEEINRGNAPAIFGDLFQLLDRDSRGESEYNIYNEDILDYLKEKNLVRDNIKIPSNLTIFATMNTCDQNVFTLDTAFKRRWRMSRIKNDFSVVSDDRKVSFPQGDISWKEFAEAVNDAILNNCNDGMAAEDKQLGAFFVQQQDCADAERFAQKVLMYLWDDVAKYDKSQLFDTNKYKTDAVIAGFVKGENVFSPNCTKLNELYEGLISSASSGAGETAQGQPQVARAEDGTGEIPEGQPEA